MLAVAACGEAPKGGEGAVNGTAQMADTLAAVYARALATPSANIFLNRARADTIKILLAGQSGAAALQNRFVLARELLQAGDTKEAIETLQALMRDAGLREDRIDAANKEVFDLLAIAWLRLGEQQNCIDNPAAQVCILPLDGEGRHKQQEGARAAIAVLARILKAFPDDHGSKWLLNVATMAIGGYPSQVPRPYLVPGLAAAKGSFPRYPNVAGDLGLGINGLAGGLSVSDFNGDGFLDLFMTGWGLRDSIRLFLADGAGGYVDKSEVAGLRGITGGLNTIHADYDNDGDDDVLVLRGAWLGDAGAIPNSLLRNRGDGRFEDVTYQAGLGSAHPTQTAAWGDFDLDGRLDLFIGNESQVREGKRSRRSELYRNNGDGTFSEVSRQVGIDLDEFVKAVVWGDVNDDGLPDLFASVLFGPNRLYLNRGGKSPSDWRFEERGREAGVQLPLASFPAWFFDFDQDGHEDLLVLSYDNRHATSLHEAVAREYLGLPLAILHEGRPVAVEPSRLFRNRGDGTFEDLTHAVGLDRRAIFAMGSNFGDLDNDGWPDFYVGTGNPDLRAVIPNRMFRNREGRGLEEVTLAGGFGHIQKGHAVAFADLDRDGDEDIYEVMGGAYEGDRFANVLFENPGWPGRHWVTLELTGRAANRSAIGARVAITARMPGGSTRTFHHTVGTGGSFGATTLAVHAGLDRAVAIERVVVRWPDAARSTTEYRDLALDRSYRIVQGEAPVALERGAVRFKRSTVGHEH